MNIVKGFASIPALANNLPGQVGQFGEVSTYSATFSRNKSNYSNAVTAAGVEFVGFTTKNNAGTVVTLSQVVSDHILSVIKWVLGRHIASAIPANANKSAFIGSLTTEFPLMSAVVINEILNGTPTVALRMPDYISWTFTDSGTPNLIKVWFSDSRFRTQYDDYEVVIIPPIPIIDQLNNNSAAVTALIAGYRPSQLLNAIATVAANVPYTMVVSKTLVWNSPGVSVATLNTDWTAVIYGAAGNDNEIIKNAIRNYIGTHSLLTVWNEVYPTLYAENEFIVIPMWNDVAIAASGLDYGIYSAGVNVGELIPTATAKIPSTYAQSVVLSVFLGANLVVANAFFRSLSFMMIGNPGNIGGIYSMRQTFPDYIDVQTDSPDFGRMTLDTRNFVVHLNDALEKALTLTDISAIPVGYTRLVRDGVVYLGFTEGAYSYLVVTKHSFT